jgi:hypothetical protein
MCVACATRRERVAVGPLDHAAREVGERETRRDGEYGEKEKYPHSPPLGFQGSLPE